MNKVRIYTSDYCNYCKMAKSLLEQREIEYEEICLSDDNKIELMEKHNWRTVPMIFIGEEFIGGFNELSNLDNKNNLQAKIKD